MPHVLRTARHCRGQPPGSVWMEDVKALMDNKAVDCADKCVDSPGSNTTNDYACGLNLILFVDLAVFSRVNPPEAMVALTRKFWLGKKSATEVPIPPTFAWLRRATDPQETSQPRRSSFPMPIATGLRQWPRVGA